MATTVRQGFETLKSNLEITGLQATTVSTRQSNLRQILANELEVLDTFLTGSYQRNTMIAPLRDADVDVFIVLDPKYYSSDVTGPASLLDRVRRAIKKHSHEATDVSRNGQAVTIAFSDFRIDVVPGFNRNGGGCFIPDSISRRWIATNPKQHVEIWKSRNAQANGKLVPFIKMIKNWNRCHSSKFRSFHLEALILQLVPVTGIYEYPLAARDFFLNAQNQIHYVLDPAGYGGNLADYMDANRRQEAINRLQAAHVRAKAAITFDLQGRTIDALDAWRVVFGDYFPSYG